MRTISAFVFLLTALLILSTTRPTAVMGANDGDELKQLQDRISVLEKEVLTNPLQPSHTVLSRLTAAEDAIKELEKHDTASAKVEGRDDETVGKSITSLQKETKDLEKRLKELEDLPQHSGTAESNDVRDFKRTVDQLDRSIDDLKERVKRLEAKK